MKYNENSEMMKSKMKTADLALCAFFAALSAILSQIIIPIGPVPVSFTHISIFAAAGLLGAKLGTVSQIVYVLLGAAGVPVFAGFTGGIGAVAGPRGGFIIGYVLCALAVGLIVDRFGKSFKILIPAMYVGWVFTYVPGVSWFMRVTGAELAAALPLCVFPFLPGDLLKTVLCAILVKRLSPALKALN